MPNPSKPVVVTPKLTRLFWSKVVKLDNDSCWMWQGSVSKRGYGRMPKMYAHRFSWALHKGTIPKGLLVLHHCDVPGCVNPHHLFVGTHQDNVDDMMLKGRHNPAVGLVNGIAKEARANPLLVTGSGNGNAKLTEADVKSIRRKFHRAGPRRSNLNSLARHYGVTPELISQIIRRVRWSHV